METRGAHYTVARMDEMRLRINALEQKIEKNEDSIKRIIDVMTRGWASKYCWCRDDADAGEIIRRNPRWLLRRENAMTSIVISAGYGVKIVAQLDRRDGVGNEHKEVVRVVDAVGASYASEALL